jgi:hypothetical protein
MNTRATQNGQAQRFDLDAAAAAAAAEAKATPFLFTYKGSDYEVPAALSWPVEVMDMIGQGDLSEALTQLLGEDQHARLIAQGINLGELNVLFDAIASASGLGDLPNSPAPRRRATTRT